MNTPDEHRSADGPDPELLELPSPRRPFRRLTLFSLTITAVAALAMIAGLWGDFRYALQRGEAKDLGTLVGVSPEPSARNTWVRGEGELSPIGGIRFERPLEADSFRMAPVEGAPKLWVQIRVPAGFENEHFVAPTVFSGRLVPVQSLGLRYSSLAVAPEAAGWSAGHLPKDAWLLVDGETPSETRWVIGLAGLFAGFAAFSLWALFELLRPATSKRRLRPVVAS